MKIYDFFKRHKDGRDGSIHGDISAHRPRKGQSDTDRSHIRMLEKRLAREQDGTWLSGSRAAQESYGHHLIEAAKETGQFLTKEECKQLGNLKRLPSGESTIYENSQQGIVYKVRNPFAKLHLKSHDVTNVLYEFIVHNLLFPETAYSFVGVSEDMDDLRFVLSQKFIFGTSVPTQKQIDEHLASLGLYPEERYYYGNEYLSVTDINATSDNVLLDENGHLLFIDPIIKMKRPALEVIAYLESKR